MHIKEIHPTDGWQVKANERDRVLFEQHRSLEDRVAVGQACMLKLALELPALVDEMDDAVAVHNRKFTGVHTIMFGTDYPHHEGTFPHTGETIERIFEGVPDEEIRMMVGGNAATLYGLDLE